jgi:hypothetical protein
MPASTYRDDRLRTLGVDGSKIFSSQMDQQEWHRDLLAPFTKQKLFREMLENTPEIARAYSDVNANLSAGRWKVVVPKAFAKDKRAKAALDLCSEAWAAMETPFRDVLEDTLTGIPWGYAIQWVTWGEVGGLLLPSKVELRPQYTGYGWVRENGDYNLPIIAFRQRDPQSGRLIDLPLDRCVHSTFGTGTGGPEGKAGLRYIYIPYRNMVRLLNIAMIAEERSGVGTWDAQVPSEVLKAAADGDANAQTQIDDFIQGLEQLSVGERNSILRPAEVNVDGKPSGWKLAQFPQIQRTDSVNKLIQTSMQRVMIGLGTQYLLLGQQGTSGGTAAQTGGQVSLATMIQQGIGNRVCDIYTVQINRKICEYNGIDTQYCPVWTYRNNQKIDMSAVERLVTVAASAGFSLLDESDRNDLRDGASLPPSEGE